MHKLDKGRSFFSRPRPLHAVGGRWHNIFCPYWEILGRSMFLLLFVSLVCTMT
jgi:hypothetical protein